MARRRLGRDVHRLLRRGAGGERAPRRRGATHARHHAQRPARRCPQARRGRRQVPRPRDRRGRAGRGGGVLREPSLRPGVRGGPRRRAGLRPARGRGRRRRVGAHSARLPRARPDPPRVPRRGRPGARRGTRRPEDRARHDPDLERPDRRRPLARGAPDQGARRSRRARLGLDRRPGDVRHRFDARVRGCRGSRARSPRAVRHRHRRRALRRRDQGAALRSTARNGG